MVQPQERRKAETVVNWYYVREREEQRAELEQPMAVMVEHGQLLLVLAATRLQVGLITVERQETSLSLVVSVVMQRQAQAMVEQDLILLSC